MSPHCDIVALMVLEHQAEAHNLIARANMQTRLAFHDPSKAGWQSGLFQQQQQHDDRRFGLDAVPLARG